MYQLLFKEGTARRGVFETVHGTVQTPAFMNVGTSAAIGFPIALAGTLGFITNGWNTPGLPEYALGFIYLPALVGIVAVSMFTAPIGAGIAHKLPVPRLKKFFACFLYVVAIKMLMDVL